MILPRPGEKACRHINLADVLFISVNPEATFLAKHPGKAWWGDAW